MANTLSPLALPRGLEPMWAGAIAAYAAVFFIGISGCHQPETRREPSPFENYQSPSSTVGERGNRALTTLFVTQRAVILGSNVLASHGAETEPSQESRERIDRAVRRAQDGREGIAIGVDRTTVFGVVRPILGIVARDGTASVEIRVGSRDEPRSIPSCVARSAAEPRAGAEDCWGRPRPTPPPIQTIDGGGPEGDGGAVAASPRRAGGDVAVSPRQVDWRMPLRLSISMEHDWVAVRIQGRLLRTVLVEGDEAPGSERMRRALGTTLTSIHSRAVWEHRASLRVADEVDWQSVVHVIGALHEAGFDQTTLIGLDRSTR